MIAYIRRFRFMMVTTILISATQFALAVPGANERKPVTPKDYGKWESLGLGGRRRGAGGSLSSDGTWLVYPIRRNNEKNELRLHNLKKGTEKVLAQGAGQQFSKDSRWLGYLIKVSAKERKKLEKKKEPVTTSSVCLTSPLATVPQSKMLPLSLSVVTADLSPCGIMPPKGKRAKALTWWYAT